jgi:hypothetical protein
MPQILKEPKANKNCRRTPVSPIEAILQEFDLLHIFGTKSKELSKISGWVVLTVFANPKFSRAEMEAKLNIINDTRKSTTQELTYIGATSYTTAVMPAPGTNVIIIKLDAVTAHENDVSNIHLYGVNS